ncbi:glycosyltransferase [Dactylosporangium sp. NPDC051485]|uniref:glycosyltransferase n=1 Tax=Dactylosporangium sp. NPDC051485 TaxID=3154846 RepID=UPI003426EA39
MNAEPQRILLVNGNYVDGTVGGTQTHTRHLAKALADEGRTVAVLCQGETDAQERIDGVEVFRVRPPALPKTVPDGPRYLVNQTLAIQNPFVTRRVEAVVRQFQPDLCHVQMLRRLTPTVLGVLRRHRVPVVQTVHELFSLWNFNAYQRADTADKIHSRRPWPVSGFKWWHRRLSTGVRHVVAPSRFALDAYLGDDYFHGVPSTIVPHFIPLEWGDPREAAARRAAEERAGPVRLLFVGRLDNYKGVQQLIAALRGMPELDVLLDIAGDGVLTPTVADFAAADPRVTFHGPAEGAQRHELYRRADALLCPSTWVETFGFVVLEAYAAGLPVIASRIGALPDSVIDGRTGLMVEPGSVPQLAAAMRSLADRKLCQRMGHEGAAWMHAFQPDRPIDRHLEVYRTATEGQRDA